MNEKSWRERVKLAKEYLKLGQDDHYLDRDHSDHPWEFVTHCEPWGSHRMEIETSVRFEAVHSTGLKFHWVFDIEPHEASGKGYYMIDVEGCQKVLRHLNGKAKTEFSAFLKECAHKVAAKADEWKKVTDNQYKTADDLMKAGRL